MTQDVAEKKIRALQKTFLLAVEDHPILHQLEPLQFNDLRKRVFRGTFQAYRLGVVGIDASAGQTALYPAFFGWLDDATKYLPHSTQREVAEMCFRTALEAYRLGAMVAVERHGK